MSGARSARGLLASAALVFASGACRDRDPNPASERPSAPPPSESPVVAETVPNDERLDLVSELSLCEIEHQGRLIDFGTRAVDPWAGFMRRAPGADNNVTRDGATYLEAERREESLELWLEEGRERLEVSLRARAGAARRVQLVVDGRRTPPVRLPDSEVKAFDLPGVSGKFAPGLHRLSLRWLGAPRRASNVLAELDWLRIKSPGARDSELGFAAPTLDELALDVALSGTPRRSLVIRPPGVVRCFVRPVAGARLRVALGFWGVGQGAAEIVARPEGGAHVVLEQRKLTGGDSGVWTPVDVEIERFAPSPIALEFRASEASRGGRVAFGDPELVRRVPPENEPPLPRVVVLVVLSGVDRRHLPPWGSGAGLPALSELSRAGTAFSRYRAPTTVAAGVLATLLTGLPARAHRVEGPLLRVPPELRLLGRLTREASAGAAFYTSVPTSFAAFGFDAGWDEYQAFSPVKDIAATEPFTRAAAFVARALDERPEARQLVVIHARGAHPPWDVTREEAQALAPDDYAGAIEPRRGGIILGALRMRGPRAGRRLVESDWLRLEALGRAALVKQDAALGKLMQVLKDKNAWESTLLVTMGDVGPGLPPELPYDPEGPLDEGRLAVPLLVKFPGRPGAPGESQASVTAEDVAVTLYRALGLKLPDGLGGRELLARARGRTPLTGEVQHATLFGRYSTRVGPWLLRGELGRTPSLCALDIDPACAIDVLAEKSIAARALWLAAYQAESPAVPAELGKATKAVAELDPEARAALTVWGDIPE